MKTISIWILVLLLLAGGGYGFFHWKQKKNVDMEAGYQVVEMTLTNAHIKATIVTTGSIEPQNRLEVKPPVNGRVEEILVKEGELVKAGQIVAWMSSTDRALLLDAARSKGAEEMEYWKDKYKAIPLVAPIDGEVIVSDIEEGQSVFTSTAILVLSDRLIVKARVDETDVGKVKVGQRADIRLDAYPDIRTHGKVVHISYESRMINNVTMYNVQIAVEKIPTIFRSGMNAEIKIIFDEKDNATVLPVEVIQRDGRGSYAMVKNPANGGSERRPVVTGISDERFIEIREGLDLSDTVVYRRKSYKPEEASTVKNPFMPAMGGRRATGGGGSARR